MPCLLLDVPRVSEAAEESMENFIAHFLAFTHTYLLRSSSSPSSSFGKQHFNIAFDNIVQFSHPVHQVFAHFYVWRYDEHGGRPDLYESANVAGGIDLGPVPTRIWLADHLPKICRSVGNSCSTMRSSGPSLPTAKFVVFEFPRHGTAVGHPGNVPDRQPLHLRQQVGPILREVVRGDVVYRLAQR